MTDNTIAAPATPFRSLSGWMPLVLAGAALALLGASDAPVRATDAEAVLVGRRIDADAVADVSARVATTINPTGTASAGAEYRRSLIAKLAGQAVTDAAAGVLPR
jgi:CO/xanthine dehydrogenase FAD-binding subunit